MRIARLLPVCFVFIFIIACSNLKLGGEKRVGPFAETSLSYRQVADRVARNLNVVKSQAYFGRRIPGRRKIVNAKTKDPGIEVTVRFDDEEGNYKVYKLGSASSIDTLVRTYDGIESAAERDWCYLIRRDFLLDCDSIPKPHQDDLKARFLKAVSE